jgi:hypothetical protein
MPGRFNWFLPNLPSCCDRIAAESYDRAFQPFPFGFAGKTPNMNWLVVGWPCSNTGNEMSWEYCF